MAVLSVLARNVTKFGGILRNSCVSGIPAAKSRFLIAKDGVRYGGDHRTFQIKPSSFQFIKVWDVLHFYLMLGIIPLGLLILYVNIFIGQAELTEIPEGYVPENHEYYAHPIKRWFAKYIYKSDQEHYEKMLHYLTEQEDVRQMRLLERKVKRVMAERSDYKAWFYKPITGKYHRIAREEWNQQETELSGLRVPDQK